LADKWIVLKFGGTSVAGRPQWETIAALARDRQAEGFRVLLVCSAVAGVTDRLSVLADAPFDPSTANDILDTHRRLSRELGVPDDAWLPEGRELLDDRLARCRSNSHPRSRAGLLAVGEWLSTRIGSAFLRQDFPAGWVDARDALQVEPEADLSPARQWLSADCSAASDPELRRRWSALEPVLVTQGFVGRTAGGETALLGRGGSDTSAALLAGRLEAERAEIWTDVPGLFSADPRLIPEARLLSRLGYDEALEMAASGARVIHPRCIRAAAATATPLEIRDLSHHQAQGTRIGSDEAEEEGVKTITCQRSMAVMLLQNRDARRQVGFLAGVFDVFRCRGVSIDLVATSETTTTVAIDRAANHLGPAELAGLAEDLGSLCRVERFDDCVCVNLVGRGARRALARLSGVL
jgi:diaminopimelate decarboxylase/aspartate kinase